MGIKKRGKKKKKPKPKRTIKTKTDFPTRVICPLFVELIVFSMLALKFHLKSGTKAASFTNFRSGKDLQED